MSEISRLVKVRDHLDRFLAVYVSIAIILGLIAGYYDYQWVALNKGLIKTLELAAIIIMIFPMMVMMNFRGLGKALKNWKLLLIVLLMNFAWGPLMAILLGDIFVTDPLVKLGLFLAWLVPCSSMSVGYVGLMKGNIEASTALVAITFLIGIPLIPLYAGAYGAAYHIHVSVMLLVITILEIIVAPLIVGIPTHEGLMRKLGKQRFREISPVFSSITMIGMFMIIFVIFFGDSRMIISHIHAVLGVFYSAIAFGTISLVFLTLLFKALKFNYWDSMAGLFPSIGKNEGTAVAIAATAFSPLVAIAPGTLPIFQVIFLITYIKLRPRIAHFFGMKGRDAVSQEEIEEIAGSVGGAR
ncbi:arsenic resistance protein [Thermoplasma sp.]|uniref:arsenic resistance protein n=1 Tax=Thermoplasma sp. TaxID=1973142 RepID=UPI00127A230B|nr:bile acid:sodium symporter [Thermoplasma sp.]KAA8921925.1 MAG: arsenic resistance protein [Thermoplasma sp.]